MSISDEEKTLRDQLFQIKFRELLDEGNGKEAEILYAEAESQGIVARSLWEIVPMLASNLSAEDEIRCPSVFETRKKLLGTVSQNYNPREVLLLLMERLKNVEDETSFRWLLRCLRDCLLRSNLSKSVDWCVDSIKSYVKKLPQPQNIKPQTEAEAPVESADSDAERLVADYKSILSFLQPVAAAAALGTSLDSKTRSYVLSFHLFLFGYPFCYLETKDSLMFVAALSQMSLLTGNLLRFHGVIEDRSLKRKRRALEDSEEDDCERNVELELFRSEENVSDLAYANYYYYLLRSDEGRRNIPQIYNPHYLMHGCLYLSTCMLKQPEYVMVTKGLRIAEATLDKIEKFSIGHEVLELSVHHNLFASLAQVMIYCDAQEDRKMALKVFRNYIDCFNIRATYLILLNLYETANHSGFLALLTNISKSLIVHCLDQDPKCEQFLGAKLERLMKRICRLPNGSASDLVEISDEVIAALNLLRFLVIRDKDNSTGIWRMVDGLEKVYLKPLREGIDLSRAHWKVKVKDLEEQKKNIDFNAKATGREEAETLDKEITVSVGGQNLPMMPASEKIKFCCQAINALDIMESIVIRINECIEENPQRSR